MSFDHPYKFYEISKDKPAKQFTAPLEPTIRTITKVGVVSPQLYFHVQVIRILLILS